MSATDPVWHAVDLNEIIEAGLEPLAPSLFAREDGAFLLYEGFIHSFVGPSESLKSWAALLACAQEIQAGRHVIYLDYEDIGLSIVLRLMALGLTAEQIVTYFHYFNPETRATYQAMVEVISLLIMYKVRLVVIDGVTESMTTQGLDLKENTGISVWLDVLPRQLKGFNVAVVTIDHTPLSDSGRPIGGQHKRAGIDVLYVFHGQAPLAKAIEAPITGVSQIEVSKDRHGAVRAISHEAKWLGSFHITAHPDGRVLAHVLPTDGTERPVEVMKAISALLANCVDPLTIRRIRDQVKGRKESIDAALVALVAEGYVTRENGPRNAKLHSHVSKFTGQPQPEYDPWNM